jgi:hypothetical protein
MVIFSGGFGAAGFELPHEVSAKTATTASANFFTSSF